MIAAHSAGVKPSRIIMLVGRRADRFPDELVGLRGRPGREGYRTRVDGDEAIYILIAAA